MAVIVALIVVALVGTIVAFVLLRGSWPERADHGGDRVITDTSARPPAPGEPSPTRHDSPVPGSRADRRRHGKP